MSAFGEHLLFLGRFLRNPRRVGAIAPSSPSLAREMVRDVPVDTTTRVVELGPGTGAFTRQIIAKRPTGAPFLAIDIDAEFCRRLRERWPDLDCVHGSATDLPSIITARDWPNVDQVLSGLPFASLPAELSASILGAIQQALRPGGTFTTFQYIHAFPTPPAAAFRREMERRFGPMQSKRAVWMNLPPAYVLTWRK